MRKQLLIGLLVAASAALFMANTTVRAEDTTDKKETMSDKRRASIVDGCVSIQAVLKTIHENDGLRRVNLGQHYELLGSDLMTPMNSRIVDNHLDGSEMISIASHYTQSVSDFRDAYILYERQLSKTIKTDCQQDPEQFYDDLEETRQLRLEVRQAVVAANKGIKDYRDSFASFRHDQLEKGDQHDE